MISLPLLKAEVVRAVAEMAMIDEATSQGGERRPCYYCSKLISSREVVG